MYWKMQFLYKIFRQNKMLCQPTIPSFFQSWNLKHTCIFFLWPNLIRAETRSTHILFLPLQKQNFPTSKSQCVCVILIMCMQYLFQRANRTPHPQPPRTPNKQKNSLPCLCVWDIPIFRVDRNVLWILQPPQKKSLPHTCHKLWTEICEIRQIFKWDLPLPPPRGRVEVGDSGENMTGFYFCIVPTVPKFCF